MKPITNPLIILSGCGGSGKTTIANILSSNRIITHTTREPRTGECDGKDYHFISKKVFNKMAHENAFIEHVEFLGNGYGTSLDALLLSLQEGLSVIVVEYEGMQKLKDFYPNSLSFFIYNTFDHSKEGMESRGDSIEHMQKRLLKFEEEMTLSPFYDHSINNQFGKLDQTIYIIKTIIEESFHKQKK